MISNSSLLPFPRFPDSHYLQRQHPHKIRHSLRHAVMVPGVYGL